MPTTQAQPNISENERATLLAIEARVNVLLSSINNVNATQGTNVTTQLAAIETQLAAIEVSMAALNAGNIVATQTAVAAGIALIRAADVIADTALATIQTNNTTGSASTALRTSVTDRFNPRLV